MDDVLRSKLYFEGYGIGPSSYYKSIFNSTYIGFRMVFTTFIDYVQSVFQPFLQLSTQNSILAGKQFAIAILKFFHYNKIGFSTHKSIYRQYNILSIQPF